MIGGNYSSKRISCHYEEG